MKITEINKEYLEKGGLIRRKAWDSNISIGLSASKNDFIYYKNSKPKTPISFFRSLVQDIMADDWELNEKTTQVWEPQRGETYYSLDRSGKILETNNVEYDTDKRAIRFGNCFKTRDEAQHMIEKIKIINQLQELSNIKFNDDINQPKFAIYYDTEKQGVSYVVHHINREIPFNIYFKTEEDCKKAIRTIGKENLKKYYFDVED